MTNKITEESLLELTLKIPITILNDGERPKLARLYLDMWNLFKCAYKNGDDVGHGEDHIYNVLRRGIDIAIAMHGYKEMYYLPRIQHVPDYFTGYLMLGLAVFTHDMYSDTDRERHHLHASDFIDRLIYINETIGNEDEIYYALHHLLRKDHHNITILSIPNFKYKENAEYSFKWLKYFNTRKSLELVSEAVRCHRASESRFPFINTLPEILSAADRDDLDLTIIINRIYKSAIDGSCAFNCDNHGFDNHIAVIDGVTHESNKTIKKLNDECWTNTVIKTYYHLWEKFSRNGYAFRDLNKDGIYMLYYKDTINEFFNEVDKVIENPYLILYYIKKEDKND